MSMAAFGLGMIAARSDPEENLSQERRPSQSEHEQDDPPPSYEEIYPSSSRPPATHAKQPPNSPVVSSESEWKSHSKGKYLFWIRELKENDHLCTQYAIGTGDCSRKIPSSAPSSSNPPEILFA
ncbi:hypothetical protein BDV97DRAFT_399448 [Delphinella strobiligena]|nr:hypothetical protein BDV97DRAFT_399448 [Delphinella strobiligena]